MLEERFRRGRRGRPGDEARAADPAPGRGSLGRGRALSSPSPGFLGLGSNVGDRLANLRAAVDADRRASEHRRDWPLVGLRDRGDGRRVPASATSTTPSSRSRPRSGRGSCSPPARRSSARSGASRRAAGMRRGRSTSTCCCSATCDSTRRGLALPHPGVTRRRFVLVPLLELAPDLRLGRRARGARRRSAGDDRRAAARNNPTRAPHDRRRQHPDARRRLRRHRAGRALALLDRPRSRPATSSRS